VLRSDKARQQREHHRQVIMPAETPWRELSPYVDEALLALPEDSRLLLVEHFLEGRSQADMAAARHVSRPTMHRRLKEALEQMRRQLARLGVPAAAAAVVTLLQHEVAAAAPKALMAELGKLAMVSGQPQWIGSSEAAAHAMPLRSTLLATAIGTMIAIIIVFIFAMLLMDRDATRTDRLDVPSSIQLPENP